MRLTVLAASWLLYLLTDMLRLTNPRPGIKPPQAPRSWHLAGILPLFAIGVLNDPLVTLFAPAILLALLLSYARLPAWYWLAALAIVVAGAYMLAQNYLLADPPLLLPLGWRDALRWIQTGRVSAGAVWRGRRGAGGCGRGEAGALVSAAGHHDPKSPTPAIRSSG